MILQILLASALSISASITTLSQYNFRGYSDAPAEKVQAISSLRDYFVTHPMSVKYDMSPELGRQYASQLQDNGTFADMDEEEKYLIDNDFYHFHYANTPDDRLGIFIQTAYRRLFQIAESHRLGDLQGQLPDRFFRAILHYGTMELARYNDMPRFHSSCFAIPAAAVNMYYAMLGEMDSIEAYASEMNFIEAHARQMSSNDLSINSLNNCLSNDKKISSTNQSIISSTNQSIKDNKSAEVLIKDILSNQSTGQPTDQADIDQLEGQDLKLAANLMLKQVALQSWTQPLRKDETDQDVVCIERFRNHVWWVGGNALAYRPLLPTAAMLNSVAMIDLLSEVCQRAISATSQAEEAFWSEGFTADGAGWGHGRQCLVWGYPIDGTSAALRLLNILNGTPWAQQLSRTNVDAIMNFFRGSTWYYYKGWTLPGLDRNSYRYAPQPSLIPYKKMLDNILKNWSSSFSADEFAELKLLQKQAQAKQIDMIGYPEGDYSGIRWFFNNDDFMKKTPEYHVDINMSSYRCDGLESAEFADRYNFCPTDGAVMFHRDGYEYRRIMGAWDVMGLPGVTSRDAAEHLTPVTNWRGYCSKHDFAAGVSDETNFGAAGYIFEKMNAFNKKSNPQNVDKQSETENVDGSNKRYLNDVLYGIKAHKAYFFLGDYFVALGSGVTDLRPDLPGRVRTVIDQTSLVAPLTLRHGKKTTTLFDASARAFAQMASMTSSDDSKTVVKNNSSNDSKTVVQKTSSNEASKELTFELKADSKKPMWLTQEGKFSYCLLPEFSKVSAIRLQSAPTDWLERNPSNKSKKNLSESADILSIEIPHEKGCKDDTYGYCVYLGQGNPPTGKLPFEVLSNSTAVQAVRTLDGTTLAAIVYDPSTVIRYNPSMTIRHDDVEVKVSAPCALLLTFDPTSKVLKTIRVTDPCQNLDLKSIDVTVAGKTYTIDLPTHEFTGSQATFNL